MNILYVALRYNYGKKEEGNSVEFNVLEQGWRRYCGQNHRLIVLNPDVPGFADVDARFNHILDKHPIDLIFYVHFTDEYSPRPESWKAARAKGIKCVTWESDASWRAESSSLPRKDLFDHFIITHRGSYEKYKAYGLNPILSQWWVSPIHVPDPNIVQTYDATLVGQKHGIRGQIVNAMQDAGIDLHLFGNYWDGFRNNHGYVTDTQKMLEAKQRGKIALNLGFPWSGSTDTSQLQIKQRHISLPALRQCQLTTWVDGIEELFEPDKEILIAYSIEELIDKTKYYVNHEAERKAIAEAGYARAQREHLWNYRIDKLLQELK